VLVEERVERVGVGSGVVDADMLEVVVMAVEGFEVLSRSRS
jgi:hypothetical protein